MNDDKNFRVVALAQPDETHVYPLHGREHELTPQCWCRPQPDAQEPRIYAHNHGAN